MSEGQVIRASSFYHPSGFLDLATVISLFLSEQLMEMGFVLL